MLKDHLEFVYRLCLNPFILSFPFKTDIFGCIAHHQTQPFFGRLLGCRVYRPFLEAPNGLKEILPANILQGLQNCSGFAKAAIGRWCKLSQFLFHVMNGFNHIDQSLATACNLSCLADGKWLHQLDISKSMPQASSFHRISYPLVI